MIDRIMEWVAQLIKNLIRADLDHINIVSMESVDEIIDECVGSGE